MNQRVPTFLVAAYLVFCTVLGGSTQIPWPNLGLQIAGIALIAWSALWQDGPENRRTTVLNLIIIGGLALALVQLVPLPPSIWTKLPGRTGIVEGLAVLGYPMRAFPISEMPYNSVRTLFAAIPALAAYLATVRLLPSARGIAAAIVLGVVLSIVLGALQVAGGPSSSAYFYKVHSKGAIGFFANGNHMATLLLVSIPMAVALVISVKSNNRNSSAARYGLGLGFLALIILGIALNGSRAGVALSIPVAVASASLFPKLARARLIILGASLGVFAAGLAVIMSNPINSSEFDTNATAATGSRGEIWASTAKAIADSFPVGTGLGTFENVYHRYEDPAEVTRSFVNHAHNDYLELGLELGAGGLLIVILFLVWWAVAAGQIWMAAYSTPYLRAATIATGAILVHSSVDFPLRTAAISTIFAACVGLMARQAGSTWIKNSDNRNPRRHVELI